MLWAILKSETCDFSHDFPLSMQSCSFSPVIDKLTRVHSNSATLIDNILVNRIDFKFSSGNIVSDISDHYSQFCIIHSPSLKSCYHGTKLRDYSRFSEESFIGDIAQTDWAPLISNGSVDKCFSSFYNKLNKLVNKHAPLKTVSKRKAKHLSKPRITRGLHRSIKIKNDLFYSGDTATYKLYRNKVLSLSCQSKRLYYHSYFSSNLNDMKKTWEGIKSLINKHRKTKGVSSLQLPDNQGITQNQSEIATALNHHFASVGPKLANGTPLATRDFKDYLGDSNSFFFDAVTSTEIEKEILSTPSNKAYGLRSCPVRLLKSACQAISHTLAELMNMSITVGIYPHKLKHAIVTPIIKWMTKLTQTIIAQYHYSPSIIEYSKN